MDNSIVGTPVPSMPTRDKNSTITLVLIGIILILCVGFIIVVIGYVGLTMGTNLVNNNTGNTVVSSAQNTTTPNTIVATDPALKVITPLENTIVNGKILVEGTATYHFTNLKIELFDNTDVRLATSSVSITPVSDGVNNWQTQLDLIMAPSTAKGKIIVSSEVPTKSLIIPVEFETYSDTPANLIIYTPLKHQVMFSNVIDIRGEAKGLFEGNLQIRLKDALDNVIYEDSVTIPDQLTEFRKFDYNFTVNDLSTAKGKTGTWEFYYLSAKDGSEVILQTIPVRFL